MKAPYRMLALTSAIHLLIMYAIGYTMVNAGEDIYLNINRLYMAGMMVAPMIVIMLLTMGHMYTNKGLNAAIGLGAVIVFGILFYFTRAQSFVGDRQFLRSMIPHHSGAIVMCERAALSDEEIKALCVNIARGQQQEIDQMRAILGRLNGAIPASP